MRLWRIIPRWILLILFVLLGLSALRMTRPPTSGQLLDHSNSGEVSQCLLLHQVSWLPFRISSSHLPLDFSLLSQGKQPSVVCLLVRACLIKSDFLPANEIGYFSFVACVFDLEEMVSCQIICLVHHSFWKFVYHFCDIAVHWHYLFSGCAVIDIHSKIGMFLYSGHWHTVVIDSLYVSNKICQLFIVIMWHFHRWCVRPRWFVPRPSTCSQLRYCMYWLQSRILLVPSINSCNTITPPSAFHTPPWWVVYTCISFRSFHLSHIFHIILRIFLKLRRPSHFTGLLLPLHTDPPWGILLARLSRQNPSFLPHQLWWWSAPTHFLP